MPIPGGLAAPRPPQALSVLTVAFLAVLLLPAHAPATPGALTQLPGLARCVSADGTSGLCTAAAGLGLTQATAISPDGENAYVASSGGLAIFDRDPATGALTRKPGTAGCIAAAGGPAGCATAAAAGELADAIVSPDGEHVYTVSTSADAVAAFDRDPATGALVAVGCTSETGSAPCGDGRGLLDPVQLAASPDGRSVYVAGSSSNAVAILGRDPASGVLTQTGCISETGSGGTCADGRALEAPSDVDVSPDGKHVYVAADGSFAIAVLDRSATDGALSQRAGTDGCVSASGTGGQCTTSARLAFPRGIALSGDGTSLYAVTALSVLSVFDRSTTTGALAQKPGTAGCVSPGGNGGACERGRGLEGSDAVAVTPDGASVYVASRTTGGGGVAVFDRAPAGGVTQKAEGEGCVTDSGEAGCADGVALGAASDVAGSPDGASAYVTGQDDLAVAVFSREGPAGTGPGPSPDGGSGGGGGGSGGGGATTVTGLPGTVAPAAGTPPRGSTPSPSPRIVRVTSTPGPNGTLSVTVSVSGPGTVNLTATSTPAGARAAQRRAGRPLIIARATRRARAAGRVRITLRPTRAARRLLRSRRRLPARLRTAFTPAAGGRPVSQVRRVTFRLRRG